jgi:hypothetical protein
MLSGSKYFKVGPAVLRTEFLAAEMKYLRTLKGCTRLDQIRNKDIRNELGISPLSEK